MFPRIEGRDDIADLQQPGRAGDAGAGGVQALEIVGGLHRLVGLGVEARGQFGQALHALALLVSAHDAVQPRIGLVERLALVAVFVAELRVGMGQIAPHGILLIDQGRQHRVAAAQHLVGVAVLFHRVVHGRELAGDHRRGGDEGQDDGREAEHQLVGGSKIGDRHGQFRREWRGAMDIAWIHSARRN